MTFEVSGDGVLAGVDNGRPVDHQSYRDDNRKAFSGQLVGIVQSTKSAGNNHCESESRRNGRSDGNDYNNTVF